MCAQISRTSLWTLVTESVPHVEHLSMEYFTHKLVKTTQIKLQQDRSTRGIQLIHRFCHCNLNMKVIKFLTISKGTVCLTPGGAICKVSAVSPCIFIQSGIGLVDASQEQDVVMKFLVAQDSKPNEIYHKFSCEFEEQTVSERYKHFCEGHESIRKVSLEVF